MATAVQSSGYSFIFGDFEFRPTVPELRKFGFRLKLQRKPLLVLMALVERAGEVVSREELQRALWPDDTFVDFELGLRIAVKKLRDALSDSAESPRYIETVVGSGYRFIAPLERLEMRSVLAEQRPVPVPRPSAAALPGSRRWKVAMILSAAAVVLLAAVLIARLYPRKTIQPRVERLTSNAAEQPIVSAAISPDGRYLAYVANQAVWVKYMGSGEVHQVAVEPILAPHELSWYSDSNTLLATTSEGVWKLSVLGGKAERIYGPAFSAVASPDGKRLAITAWDRRSLWCAGSSGEDAHEIARLPEHSDGYLSRPAWSPHGKRIAYMEHWQDGQKIEAEIATVRPDGHDERVLLRRFPIMQIHWMADGRLLFGVGKGPLGYNNLWSVSVDEQTGRASSAEQPLTSWPDFRFGEPSSTSDGHTIVFVRAMPETDVYAADLARGAAEVGPLKRVTFGASYSYTYPAAWDLAENSLLIVVNDAGKLSIARQPLDSMAPSSVLASSDGLQYSPQFTADHKWIVWIRESHSNAEVLRMPRAGGAADVLDREPGQAFSLRCPMLAGQDCIFSAAQGDETIFRAVTPELGKSRELFRWKDLSGQLNFEVAPQGDRMLVCQAEQPKAAESDAGKVFLVDLPSGGNRRNLPFGCPANITWWSWLPSSKGWLLARITRSGTGGSELLRVDETGASTVLWSSKSQRLGEPVISPDGRHIAFASYGSERNVWALHF